MSFIYFIRHAQAGTRDNYDVLSELGHRQARLLGEHFVSHGVKFSAVVSGAMRRQQHTAEIVCETIARSGNQAPQVISDERWNEFSLISIYRAIERRLVEENAEFARDYKEMLEALQGDPHTVGGATGRCDRAVVTAWMSNQYPEYEGESWAAFRERIQCCAAQLPNHKPELSIAVFTSATPIAIAAGAALGLSDDKLLSVLGVLYNTGVTIMKAREGDMRLFTLNATPHLTESLRTLR